MARNVSRRTLLGTGLAAAAAVAAGTYTRRASAAETVRILYTNDTHAHLEPFTENNRSIGGIARRRTLINQIRALGGNVVLLDAGDVFQGTLYFNLYAGKADLAFINALGYDAMTLGNHEFDRGPGPLADFIRDARFPVVSANLVAEPGSALAGLVSPWTVRRVGGSAVGIVGLTTNTTPALANAGPSVRFTDHYGALQGGVDRLRGAGIPIRIGLTHVGVDDDAALAAASRGLGVIVGGHSHTTVEPTPMVVQGADGNPVLVVQAAFWGRYLGVLDVQFDDNGVPVAYRGALVPIDGSVAEDAQFAEGLRPWASGVQELRARPAGTALVLLDASRPRVREQETNFGNLIADAMLARTASDRAQIAFMNSGGIRDSIPAGPVSYGQILEVLPFGNTIVDIDITGAELVQALENSVSAIGTTVGTGRFAQVAGVRFSFDPARPVGSRVQRVEIGDRRRGYQPVDLGAVYRVAINDFMASGGDDYTVFRDRGRNVNNSGILLAEMLIDYFEQNSTVTAQLEGRIESLGRLTGAIGLPHPDLTPVDALWRPGEGLKPLSRPIWTV